jgi:primosomal protein N' (replication factor Y)
MRLATVAVPVPQLDALTYRVPPGLSPVRGARVLVPLGARTVTGWVLGVGDAGNPDPGEPAPAGPPRILKDVLSVLDDEPLLPAAVFDLALWVGEYYMCGAGQAIAAAMPALVWNGRAPAPRTARIATCTPAGLDSSADGHLTVRQREALGVLRGAPGGLEVSVLTKRGWPADVVGRLARRGLVSLERVLVTRDPMAGHHAAGSRPDASQAAVDPTAEQRDAIERLAAIAGERRFHVAVLHGVTGSGKTEVYRRLAVVVRDTGRQVLILVPEIALTPAVAAAFRDAFGDRVAIQHSGLSDGERYDQWHRIRRGEVDIVVGTRSAVFAPLGAVGLVIVDEEHDASYKQEEAPRYHARDVAVVRARDAHALVVLGSATPSLETYEHARAGRYERIAMDRRVLDRPLADVRVVNMREERAALGPEAVLSRALHDALAGCLLRGEQAIVLLNRRGYASAVFCRQCGGTLQCPNCSVSLTVHRAVREARCHYCDHAVRVPDACVSCGAPYVEYVGIGTERVEAEIRAVFPAARVARVDRDTIRRRGAIDRVLARFARADLDVLVGTQMLAKGHDFPAVTLVGVISADVGLGLADFRAAERTFQLLTQVAGRAGRGERPGEAIVQTMYPDHYSIVHARRQDYAAFFAEEIGFRRAMRYPPALSLVNVIVRGTSEREAMAGAGTLVRDLRRAVPPTVQILGPARAPLVRLRGEHRAQCLIKGRERRLIRVALRRTLAAHPALQRHVTVDVDPLAML